MPDEAQHRPSHPDRPHELEEIPVEDLIRMTREFTRRITNEDRKRLGIELRETGHQRRVQLSAPVTLQQFFSGEIDLDTDLARRFANAPLLSSNKFYPKPGEPVARRATAIFSSNDDSATVSVDAYTDEDATLDFTFTMFSALALRFRLSPLAVGERQRWLDLMRRPDGITFLWTRQRWEQPHLIFVVREYYGRVYAFSPQGTEAAARLTPDMIAELTGWLEDIWFPGRREEREARAAEHGEDFAGDVPSGDFVELPTHMRRPSRRRPHLRDAIPDAPEEQWDEEPEPTSPPATDDWAAADDVYDESEADHTSASDLDSDHDSDLDAGDLEW